MHKQILSMLFLFFVGASTPSANATKLQPGGAQYHMDKAPEWVMKIPAPTHPIQAHSTSGSTQILLSDTQINLLESKPVYYFHEIKVAQERAGLEQISTIKIRFNPSFETLTLHDLAVFRDGKRIDQLKTARIDLAQRERRLEEGIYDEDIEAIVVLTDVRIGDNVEYAYSITGANPVFGGKYSSIVLLNQIQPVAKLSVRVQYPAFRKIHYKLVRSDLSVNKTTQNNVRTLSLSADSLSPVRLEQDVPSIFSTLSWLQISEFETWEEVNSWSRTLYSIPNDLSPEIDIVLSKLKSESKTTKDLVAKTLAWVQNEIRYYSVSVGTSSHKPNHPNLTFRQRFGDCKDKSVLLSAMLQKLGIKAEPALVSNAIRKNVADLLPAPILFDHIIVRTQIGEETYWLDGTQTYQGKKLETLGFTPFSKALLATSPSRDLVEVIAPSQNRNGTRVVETFSVTKYGVPVKMTVEKKYIGAFAEQVRRHIATVGVKRFVELQHAEFGKSFPNIALNGEAVVNDDDADNVVTLTQSYTIPQVFVYEDGQSTVSSVYARSIIPWVRFPGTPNRKMPLSMPYPASFDHLIVFELPNKFPTTLPAPKTWGDRHLTVNNSFTIDGENLSSIYGLRVLRDEVAATDFANFSENFKQSGWPLLFSSVKIPIVERTKLRSRLEIEFAKSGLNLNNPDQADKIYLGFLRDYAIADESIRSGLLEGTLLAKAYRDRAQAASSLNRRSEALVDVNKSIKLDPTDAALILKAEIQLYNGDYQDSLVTLKSVTKDGDSARFFRNSGMAYYYLGNFNEAQLSFHKAAKVAGSSELSYSLLWLAMSVKKMGGNPANEVKNYRQALGNIWPVEVLSLMLGESKAEKLLTAAKQDEKESRMRLCEAYFFLGQLALIDGNITEAKQWFQKSINTKVIGYIEYTFSQHELKRLGQTN
jgi:lipoprotein NlpI